MYDGKKVTAVIVAAGSGKRMGGPTPKQFLKMGGRTILATTIQPFEEYDKIDSILVMTGGGYVELCEEICCGFHKVEGVYPGGRERQDTVYEALRRIPNGELVLIHDGVRPFVTAEVIENVLRGAQETGAAVPAVACKDTVRQVSVPESWQEAPVPSSHTLDRKTLFQVQTPQGFHSELIRKSYEAAYEEGFLGTDDASLAERAGHAIAIVEGDYANIKITTKEDLPVELRVGTGFDVHRLVEGRKLILGGVEIPYEKGLDGHSDADVMIHALMDAMLGAAGLGDIGRHFPDTDPTYKGADSRKLLEVVRDRVAEAGYTLGNADVTIIAQKPKLAGYIASMEANLAETLGVAPGRINVKATTTEKLGFTGRGEGIAAEAVCMLTGR